MRGLLEFLHTPLTVLHIVVCIFLMLVVLIQPGKSGGIGAALGGAGAQQVFGGRGAGNFLTKTTWVCATVFFLTSVTLAYLSSSTQDSLTELQESLSSGAATEESGEQVKAPTTTAEGPSDSEEPSGSEE